MHRHGYQGRKLRRERDQRRALLKGLATQLIEHGSIETTLPKAKEIVPYVEVLITKAKCGGLHNRRQLASDLTTIEAAHKLVDDIAPKLKGRDSGHLRIKRTRVRVGDSAQLARVSFVDDITTETKSAEKAAEKKVEKPAPAKSAVQRTAAAKAKKA
jgi:large subunit ribosomal protein L17